MDHKDLESRLNIHELGINYVRNLLDSAGFAIHEVNEDLNSPFQLFAKVSDRAFLIAIRTACHPNVGTIDDETREKLIEEAEKLNAIPHFAGLSLTSMNGSDIQLEEITTGGEYKIIFNGMNIVR